MANTGYSALAPKTSPAFLMASAEHSTDFSLHTAAYTLLVVEDDPIVRRLMCTVLTRKGYRVLEAATAEQALALSTDLANAIDLLIVDHSLGTVSGPELAAQLRVARPDLKVLHVSGHSGEMLRGEGALLGGAAFLSKPFRASDLHQSVSCILERKV